MIKCPVDLTTIRSLLEQYLDYLAGLDQILSTKSKAYTQGCLHVSGSDEKYCFYRNQNYGNETADSAERPKEQYLSCKKDMELIKKLAQQDYEKKLNKEVAKQRKALQSIVEKLPRKQLEEVYSSLKQIRKELVDPVIPDREKEIQRWESEQYVPSQFPEDAVTYMTNRGERVRSKTEKIIADKYLLLGIPYFYEPPLQLKEKGRPVVIRPDFKVLNKRTMKVYYHEHLGMMGDPSYAKNALRRLDLYQENGLFIGEHLLITYEAGGVQFNEKQFENLILRYLR